MRGTAGLGGRLRLAIYGSRQLPELINRGEEGILSHCRQEDLETGMHPLRIAYGYRNEEGEAKVSLIPFWYSEK